MKKCGLLKILHEKLKQTRKIDAAVLAEYVHSFEEAIEHNREIEPLLNKAQVVMTYNLILVILVFSVRNPNKFETKFIRCPKLI